MQLGNIIATEKELRKSDVHWDRLERERLAFGQKQLGHFDRRNYGGEIRWHDGEARYAIISRSMRVLWFEKRTDGHWYPARQSQAN